ncbi:MAG: 30S ribosomal protein S16 [Candidatus Ancillula sp.]|nr:30S ribosomal protein S16 [Candidatus Ancillula sp.]
MATKIRLKRFGKKRAPFYRVVVIDSRKARDGQAIEEIGIYHPTREPSVIEVNSDRAQYWLGVGAKPSEIVQRLLELTGDWAKFKGEKNTSSKVIAQPEKLTIEDKVQKIADDAEKLKQKVNKKLAEEKAAKEAEAKEAESAAAAKEAEASETGTEEVSGDPKVDENSATTEEVPPTEANASEGGDA